MASDPVPADAAVVAVPAVAMPAARAGDGPGRGNRNRASGIWHLPGCGESAFREAFERGSVVVVVVLDLAAERLELERGFVDGIEVWELRDRVPRGAEGETAGTPCRTGRRSRDLGGNGGRLDRRTVGFLGRERRGWRREGGSWAGPVNGLCVSRGPWRFGIQCRFHRVQSP